MSRPHKYPKAVSECEPHTWRDLSNGIWVCGDCGVRQPARSFPVRQKPSRGPDEHDPVNRPAHYTQHPSGIECIQITEHMGFCLGNAMKYLWRADLKNGTEDLQKARWYLDREIARREQERASDPEAPR